MSQFLAQILTPIVFGRPYFGTAELYRKTKTNLSRTDDRSTTIPKLGWVGPPTPRTVGTMGTPKGTFTFGAGAVKLPSAEAVLSSAQCA